MTKNSRKTAAQNPIPGNKPFQKGQSGNPKGRAPKYITTITDKTGYRNSEIADCMKSMLKMNQKEISEIQKSESTPILENLVASAIIGDIQKMELRNLDSILNRCYGKPKEQIEIDDNTNPYNLQPSILAAAIIMNERQLKDEKKQ